MTQNVAIPQQTPLFKDIISPKYNILKILNFLFLFLYRFIFGYRGDFKNNIFLHQEAIKIIYPAGNNIVVYNTDNKSQSFLYPYPGTCCITAMAISPSRRFLF